MSKIGTDYKWGTAKISAKLFKMASRDEALWRVPM